MQVCSILTKNDLQVQAELEAHRIQGKKQLLEIKASLKDLLSAVSHGPPFLSHLLCAAAVQNCLKFSCTESRNGLAEMTCHRPLNVLVVLLLQVKGATYKHLLLGSTLIVLHLSILAVASKRRERLGN